MRSMSTRMLFLCSILLITVAHAGTEEATQFFLQLPDKSKLEVSLPGEIDIAEEESTGQLVPVFNARQAAKIAVELLVIGRADYIPRTITEMKLGPTVQTGSHRPLDAVAEPQTSIKFNIARPWKRRISPGVEIPATVWVKVSKPERFAIRQSDRRRLLLFTPDQAEKVFSQLVSAGLTIPEAAVAIAGFSAPELSADVPTPLNPGCSECLLGNVCEVNGNNDCCGVGTGRRCLTCNLCATDFEVGLTVVDTEEFPD